MTDPSEQHEMTWEEIEAARNAELGSPRRATQQSSVRRSRRVRNLIEWVLAIGGALLVAWAIQAFLFQAFVIPSASMEPTLIDRDRILVNKRYGTIHRSDVVVFKRPPDVDMGEVEDLIKRVIALEGDTVEGRGGSVFVNGVELIEPYLPPETTTEDFAPVLVPEDHLFVMGDNRGHAMSFDSRFYGPISEDLVVGRAFVIVWPVSRFGTI